MIAPFDKMVRDMSGTVTDFTKEGKCSECGECCGDFLPVSDAEIRRIRDFVRKHGIRECNNVLINTPINFKCPFRDDNNRVCTIYEVRPEICRSFMCNYARDKIDTNKALFHQKYNVISMRATFFNNEYNKACLSWFLGGMPRVFGGQDG